MSSGRIVLLDSERNLRARITVADFAGYVNAIESAVGMFFTSSERRTSRELAIQLSLTAAAHEGQFFAKPELTEDVAEDLHKEPEGVPTPKVSGPVKVELLLSVWSVASKQ